MKALLALSILQKMKKIVEGVLSLAPLQGRGGAEDSRGTVPGRWMEQVYSNEGFSFFC